MKRSVAVAGIVALAAIVPGSTVMATRVEQARSTRAVPEPFEWSAKRQLVWSDYLGRPDMMSQAAAYTVYVLSVEHGCSASAFSFRVAVMFQPSRSWVKTDLLMRAGERRVLEHEQGHFDLAEVQARRLRRALGAVKEPCEAPAAELNELASQYVIEDAERQQRYDRETIYSLDGGRQGVWLDDIRKQLKELAPFVH